MRSNESLYPRPEVMLIEHLLDPNVAAKLLCANLGKTVDHWLLFLREERHPGIDPKDWAIPFAEYEGEFWYDKGELYRFIARRCSGEFVVPDSQVPDVPFYCEAHADIDYHNQCRFVVNLSFPQRSGRPWLSLHDARELAASLIYTADWCDQHRCDPLTGQIIAACTESHSITGVTHE